ncbi:MAG TPA: condensation domain-containing protein, partial [Pyrinomonadaceae bacterium]|nr:condensation domain-containing protein [Pyrinomonadaceae bacterium]
LAGAAPTINLPTDHPRPAVEGFRGAIRHVRMLASLLQSLKELSQREGVTLFMTLLAGWQALLSRWSGEKDVIVGSPIANRTRAELEGLIGFFVNSLVLRAKFKDDPNFKELLAQVREVTLGAYAHQDCPFEKLVEVLQPERELSHNPLFQVIFALQNAPQGAVAVGGLEMSAIETVRATARFDLEFHLWESEQGLGGFIIYSTELFDAQTIERLMTHYERLLTMVSARPEQRLSDVNLLSEAEEHQLLVELNQTTTVYPRRNVAELFEEQVVRRPEETALVFGDERLNYRELNERANQLAHRLRRLGVGTESLVGVCVERSIEMVVALLGILKAGGAYVPLDPNYPSERLAFMLKDARVNVLLTQEWLLSSLPEQEGLQVVWLGIDGEAFADESKENLQSEATSENL